MASITSPGVVNFTEQSNTAAPNAAIPVSAFTAKSGTAAADVALVPKANGAVLAAVPNNLVTGGNKRGVFAVDLQLTRNQASQVASGSTSVIVGGSNNTASSSQAVVVGGTNNLIDGSGSAAVGGNAAFARGCLNATVHASGNFNFVGDAQRFNMELRNTTTDATPSNLSANGGGLSADTVPTLPNNSATVFDCLVIAREAATGDSAGFRVSGVIRRGANAASTAVVGAVTSTALGASAGAATWVATAVADVVNGAVLIQVTGQAAKTIQWVAAYDSAQNSAT